MTTNIQRKRIIVEEIERASASFLPLDIHNNGPTVGLHEPVSSGDWQISGSDFTYTGRPDLIAIHVSLFATDQGASNYWARPSLRITETVSGWEGVMDDLAMQQNTTYSGNTAWAFVVSHIHPPADPHYTLEWFDTDHRTATLIPSQHSNIIFTAHTEHEIRL